MNNNKKIPKIIHITYKDKNKIPNYVFYNLKKYAYDYDIIYYSDNDCFNFLKKYYNINFANLFNKLSTGAHKADFFRYCLLYKIGGIYIDIKIKPYIYFNKIFNHYNDNNFYSVLSNDHIFQGIIATYPNNDFFKLLINDFFKLNNNFFTIKMNAGNNDYHYFTIKFYYHLKNILKNKLKVGLNSKNDFSIILFNEKNININNENKDFYGEYWNIFDKNDKHLFKTRYNSYPW